MDANDIAKTIVKLQLIDATEDHSTLEVYRRVYDYIGNLGIDEFLLLYTKALFDNICVNISPDPDRNYIGVGRVHGKHTEFFLKQKVNIEE